MPDLLWLCDDLTHDQLTAFIIYCWSNQTIPNTTILVNWKNNHCGT